MIGGMLIGAGLITLTIPLGVLIGRSINKIGNLPCHPLDRGNYLEYLSQKHKEMNYTTDSRED